MTYNRLSLESLKGMLIAATDVVQRMRRASSDSEVDVNVNDI